MPILSLNNLTPTVNSEAFIAPDSWIIGDVAIGVDSSIFFYSVLRGDIFPIVVGARTNIQEHSLLHTSSGIGPCIVGDDVTVGHRAILHGCKINNNCIIGMGAIILDGAEIGENSIVGAGSLVTMNKKFPPNSMIMGSPAKVTRELNSDEIKSITLSARNYMDTAKNLLKNLSKVS